MIIKCTVHDNDYHGLMIGFMYIIPHNLCKVPNDRMTSLEEYKAAMADYKHLREILNPNNDIEITNYIKNKLKKIVRDRFIEYVNASEEDDYAKKYLIKNFEVSIVSTITDKWENGESYYWLQHSNTIINQ